MTDINRLIRHISPVLVTWLVTNGHLPESNFAAYVEIFAIVGVTAASLLASKWRDRVK